MEFLLDYITFFAKTITIIIAVLIPLIVIVTLTSKQRQHQKEYLDVTHLNHRFKEMSNAIDALHMPKKEFKERVKKQKKERKSTSKKATEETNRKRVYVCDFEGDMEASNIDRLRVEITAVLTPGTATG